MKKTSFFTRFGKSEASVAWFFMTPGLILLALFVFWPIIYSIPLALTNYSIIGKTEFVGLDNFVKALQDRSFITSLVNSLFYVIVVPFIQIISILMAILVNSNVKGIKLFRTAYYIP
ncbi:MAG TPA: sugar ABC transporter permease, partial [Paenibacillus sp.]